MGVDEMLQPLFGSIGGQVYSVSARPSGILNVFFLFFLFLHIDLEIST